MGVEVRTRKRPAPGTSPQPKPESQSLNVPSVQDLSYGWQGQDATDGTYTDPQYFNNQSTEVNTQMQPMQTSNSTNQLTRRTPNQPVIPIPNYTNAGNGSWQVSEQSGQGTKMNGMQSDDLDQRALAAKKDAESKRKQIPPFVQKLSSFLDESRNTELIRWSESGDSFIVIDEDEFARVMIPEMFKHNNYASFVRQLNMYGFHKKVGLSDNSMRASERKNKNPSEYSNPYFKRGRPNLLWLIQKPKNQGPKGGTKGNKSRSEEYDEEIDETFGRDHSPFTGNLDTFDDLRGGRQNLLTMGSNQPTGLPQDQLASVQRELQTIRTNQNRISQMLLDVRREHQALYGQAKAFHDLHEKHDNSINAILTFLATVYSKNLNGEQGGLGDMFPGSIPSNDQNRGNVVDMGDVREHGENSTPRPFRRAPLLLGDGKTPQASAQTPSDGKIKKGVDDMVKQYNRQMRTYNDYPRKDQTLHSPAVQELSDRSGSSSPRIKPQSDNNQQQQQQIPQADIMSMLNNANAKNNAFSPSSPMDFSEALSHLQNSQGNTPLSPDRRLDMLQLMGNESNSPNSNALAYPTTSTPMASQAQFDQTSNNLDQLGQIIREQGNNINTLSNTLTPLSPSGSIPGIDYTGAPGDYSIPPNQDLLDLDNIFNTDSYFGQNENGEGNGGDNIDFGDFNFGDDLNGQGGDGGFSNQGFGDQTDPQAGDGVGDGKGEGEGDSGLRVDEVGSSNATSPNTVATVEDDDGDGGVGGVASPPKRRKIR
ncbi:uncharacterized protein KY384_000135 [Bacidia gigantensis]|uniref:uncharacterized protein n=1 Tax=Bacidia gigantensis TaxID=2732470 RepID=UPI001D04260E|nr:uncharacterized protein KY384_000135 [Bacidia gigantensis]KAG8526142.1 hypothetical protein KY384_000135 [Bacidia gigantensis]